MRKCLFEFWSKRKAALIAWGVILFAYLLMFVVGIGCPIKFLTGISCAGCGMTRACVSAVGFDFTAAFAYHPLWVMLPFSAFFLLLFKIKKKKRAFYAVIYISAFAMLAVYLYRLLWTDSEVVVFSPESGAIYRAVQSLLSLFILNDR